MLRGLGFGRVLLTSLLVGCDFSINFGPSFGDFDCPVPTRIDTLYVQINNKEDWMNFCERLDLRDYRHRRQICNSRWELDGKQMVGQSIPYYQPSIEGCAPKAILKEEYLIS